MPATDVDVPVGVFGDHFGVVAREPLRGRVGKESGSLRPEAVDANQAASRRGEPEPARTVHVDVDDRAWRQPLGRGKERESALRVPRQPVVETNPDVAGTVFAKRPRQFVLERGSPGERARSRTVSLCDPSEPGHSCSGQRWRSRRCLANLRTAGIPADRPARVSSCNTASGRAVSSWVKSRTAGKR